MFNTAARPSVIKSQQHRNTIAKAHARQHEAERKPTRNREKKEERDGHRIVESGQCVLDTAERLPSGTALYASQLTYYFYRRPIVDTSVYLTCAPSVTLLSTHSMRLLGRIPGLTTIDVSQALLGSSF